MKTSWIIAGITGVCACISGYGYYAKNQENQRLALNNIIYIAENRILKEEVSSLERKPTYEEGSRDSILKMGGPQIPGAYRDGWDAAIQTLDTKSYADGYHAAIQQFGYAKINPRWLIAENEGLPKSVIEKTQPNKPLPPLPTPK
jgi:hypothetical protein